MGVLQELASICKRSSTIPLQWTSSYKLTMSSNVGPLLLIIWCTSVLRDKNSALSIWWNHKHYARSWAQSIIHAHKPFPILAITLSIWFCPITPSYTRSINSCRSINSKLMHSHSKQSYLLSRSNIRNIQRFVKWLGLWVSRSFTLYSLYQSISRLSPILSVSSLLLRW